MKDINVEELTEIRDLMTDLHDRQAAAGKNRPGLTALELAGLRDSIRRLETVIKNETEPGKKSK